MVVAISAFGSPERCFPARDCPVPGGARPS